MIKYSAKEVDYIKAKGFSIASFISDKEKNIDLITVESFGEEWSKFDNFDQEEIEKIGDEYFDIVSQEMLNKNSLVLDIGCGSGRWDMYLADKVNFIEAIDPSNAVLIAAKMLKEKENIRITHASVSNIPFKDESFDFVMSLGVLHHIPDTPQAVIDAVKKIKKGGCFLIYLYYNLDNRTFLYKTLFFLSNIFRRLISKLPKRPKKILCDIIAFTIYLPLIALAKFIKFVFPKNNWYKKFPLSYYVGKSLKVIRNESLDRFGTPLEQRFSKIEIKKMLENAGLNNIVFSEKTPYWHAVGKKI